MNYLAHALLAPPPAIAGPRVLLGNMLGDFVKGPLPGDLDPELAAAVAHHRAIDAICDRHPAFVASRRRFFATLSHYAGVVVDVCYDHLLCVSWERHADGEDFDDFVTRIERAIDAHAHRLPPAMARHAQRMRDSDLLRRFRTIDGLRADLARLSRRIRRPVDLTAAIALLEAHHDDFAREFDAVFTTLRSGGHARH